jgi:hypothetical protein
MQVKFHADYLTDHTPDKSMNLAFQVLRTEVRYYEKGGKEGKPQLFFSIWWRRAAEDDEYLHRCCTTPNILHTVNFC